MRNFYHTWLSSKVSNFIYFWLTNKRSAESLLRPLLAVTMLYTAAFSVGKMGFNNATLCWSIWFVFCAAAEAKLMHGIFKISLFSYFYRALAIAVFIAFILFKWQHGFADSWCDVAAILWMTAVEYVVLVIEAYKHHFGIPI